MLAPAIFGGKSRYSVSRARARSGNGSLKLSQLFIGGPYYLERLSRGVVRGFVFGYHYFYFIFFSFFFSSLFNREVGGGWLVFFSVWLFGWLGVVGGSHDEKKKTFMIICINTICMYPH